MRACSGRGERACAGRASALGKLRGRGVGTGNACPGDEACATLSEACAVKGDGDVCAVRGDAPTEGDVALRGG